MGRIGVLARDAVCKTNCLKLYFLRLIYYWENVQECGREKTLLAASRAQTAQSHGGCMRSAVRGGEAVPTNRFFLVLRHT